MPGDRRGTGAALWHTAPLIPAPASGALTLHHVKLAGHAGKCRSDFRATAGDRPSPTRQRAAEHFAAGSRTGGGVHAVPVRYAGLGLFPGLRHRLLFRPVAGPQFRAYRNLYRDGGAGLRAGAGTCAYSRSGLLVRGPGSDRRVFRRPLHGHRELAERTGEQHLARAGLCRLRRHQLRHARSGPVSAADRQPERLSAVPDRVDPRLCRRRSRGVVARRPTQADRYIHIRLGHLYRTSPVGMAGSFLVGAVGGSDLSPTRMDRRLVIRRAATAFLSIRAGIGLSVLDSGPGTKALVLTGIFGFLSFPLCMRCCSSSPFIA